MDNLIKQLEDYRLKNRLTQAELAKLLGVSYVSIKGIRAPKSCKFIRLSN